MMFLVLWHEQLDANLSLAYAGNGTELCVAHSITRLRVLFETVFREPCTRRKDIFQFGMNFILHPAKLREKHFSAKS